MISYLKLTTPIVNKPTKKIQFASKSKPPCKDKENIKPNDNANNNIQNIAPLQSQQRRSTNNHNNSHSAKTTKSKKRSSKDANIHSTMPNSKQAKSIKMNGHLLHSQQQRKTAKSISPPNITIHQTSLYQYSLSLQIKNAECELLKNENKELKARLEQLLPIEMEHKDSTQKIAHLEETLVDKIQRIGKLERKLESCGIDPIALQSPQFMNEDTQKSIIFWRARLFKAREKLNERREKQKEIMQGANYYMQQLNIN